MEEAFEEFLKREPVRTTGDRHNGRWMRLDTKSAALDGDFTQMELAHIVVALMAAE